MAKSFVEFVNARQSADVSEALPQMCRWAEEYAEYRERAAIDKLGRLLFKFRARFWPKDKHGQQLVQVVSNNYTITDCPNIANLLDHLGFHNNESQKNER